MSDKKTSADKPAAPAAAPQLLKYEVLAPSVTIGRVIAYRTARVNLTKEQAEALNAAQPDTVRFIGI